MSKPLPVLNGVNAPEHDDHAESPLGLSVTPPFAAGNDVYGLGHAMVQNMERETGRPEHITLEGMPTKFKIPYAHLPRPLRLIRHAMWTAGAIARYGWPGDIYYYEGGIGDEVTMSAVFRELAKRGHPPATMLTPYPELYANNPDVGKLLPADPRLLELHRRMRRRVTFPIHVYEHVHETDTLVVPPYPLIARMCRQVGLTGEIDLRPYLFLTDEEKAEGRVAKRQVAIVSSGLTARFSMRNKQWYPERYQAVVDALKDRFDFVQVGDTRDPGLDGVLDLRGKTTLRQTAAVLNQSLLLIGHEGLLMHLARAVDCRSVIIYGGRVHPYQIGYGAANENLYTPLPCAPCLKRNACDFDRLCMQKITSEMVVAAALRLAERHGEPLPVETYTILGDQRDREAE